MDTGRDEVEMSHLVFLPQNRILVVVDGSLHHMHFQVVDAEIQIPEPEHHARKDNHIYADVCTCTRVYVCTHVCVCVCTCVCVWDSLVVQDPRGCLGLKLLLLQDTLKVLHTLLQVPHMGWQVTVEEAHWVAEHCHPRTDTPLISLWMGGESQNGT